MSLKNEIYRIKKITLGLGLIFFAASIFMMRTGGYVFVFLVLISGCSSETSRISGQAYFPLRVGNFQIYTVSETDINQVNCGDGGQTIKNYQLKTLVYDSVKNVEGGYTYYIHRYTRADETQPWEDLDTWSARISNNQVIVTEGNTAYVKLPLSFYSNEKWNGNLYNNLGEEDYLLTNVGKPNPYANTDTYKITATVVQSDNQDYFVYQDKRVEVYAPTVGLIYKETTQLNYFQDPCYGEQKVKAGIIYIQALVNNGHE